MAEIIVALDVPRAGDAYGLLDRLPEVRWVKVGSVLFVREGPALVRQLTARGLQVFLDLKWHDIPHTVAEAARGAAGLGVAMASVHALGGRAMVEAAAAAAPELPLVAVTVLTSHSAADHFQATGRRDVDTPLSEEAGRLARLAVEAGARGVVVSPHEAGELRRTLGPTAWLVVPGIRWGRSGNDDQRRTARPADAVRSGATHLVVGRPVVRAEHPAQVYKELCEAAGT